MNGKKPKKRVIIRMEDADLREAKANAKANGLSLSEYIRRRINGRPLKALKPKASAMQIDAIEQDDLEQIELNTEQDELTAKIEVHCKRQEQGRRLALAAGGVERWFASMTPQQREEWADQKEYLLRCERFDKEKAEWFRTRGFQDPAEVNHAQPAVVTNDPGERTIRELPQIADRVHPTVLPNGMILD